MKTPKAGLFNTLAQNGTGPTQNKPETQAALIQGQGSDLSNKSALTNRAKKKTITQAMSLGLLKVAEGKKRVDRYQTYWNVYHCQGKLITANDRIYGRYCKNRMCTVCSGIRKALIIRKYLPEIMTWEDPHFVTLTAKAVSKFKLKARFRSLNRGFSQILDKYKKRAQRGTGFKLKGIKSMESNFNPDKLTYNPHFHILVPNKETAEIFVREWLEKCTPKHALKQCQDIQRVKSTDKALIEIIKYGAKIFTEAGTERRARTKKEHEIYAAALFNIFEAMKGTRIFDRFGFNVQKQTKDIFKGLDSGETTIGKWEFEAKQCDWINRETGARLSEYMAPDELIDLLKNCMDTELE